MRSMRMLALTECLCLLTLILGSWANAQETPEGDRSEAGLADRTPENVVREMSEFLLKQQQYQCKMTSVVQMVAQGVDNKMETVSSFKIDRPSRLAIRLESGINGVTIICDGTKRFTYLPALQRYSTDDAPQDISETLDESSVQLLEMSGPLGGSAPIGGDAYYTTMMTGVTESKYLGVEEVDGVPCHHCKFEQAEMSWELWSSKGDHPVPRKILMDLSDQVGPDVAMIKDAKFTFLTLFSDWDLKPTFTDQDFRFDPPADAQQVDDLLGDLFEAGQVEGPHPLLGKPAPAFKANNLDNESVDLASHFGNDIVILDFWATWCGPCVQALPKIAAVAKTYEQQGVKFFAVNVGEDRKTIQEFLDSQDLKINVLRDIEGEIAATYQADAIPQTVIVGVGGQIQVVHVGLDADMEGQLVAELDALLNGEDLAAQTLKDAKETAKQIAFDDFGTKPGWSLPGRWSGVVCDHRKGGVVAINGSGVLVTLDVDGVEQSSAKIAQGVKLRIADLIAGGENEFLCFDPWGQSVKAFSQSGETLWDYSGGQSIDDVWAGDLNGDGADEVIVGYNGNTGLHVLDHRGKLLWKYTEIGNVWHVSSGDVDGDGEIEVVTTSASGQVHVFGADGKSERTIELPIYGNMVRANPNHSDSSGTILVAGSAASGEVLVSLTKAGETQFKVDLPSAGTDHVDELMIATDRPWAAVAMRGGLVHVVDTELGKIIATVSGQGQQPDVAWLSRSDRAPLLVVSTGRDINTFEVEIKK